MNKGSEELRFNTINKFQEKANTEYQRAWATLKCEPTAWSRTEMLMLFQTASGYVKIIDEALSKLEKLENALTPPTADEVIKALSEYFKGLTGVWYDKKTKSFIHLQYGRNEVISRCFEARLNDKRVTVIVTLPPHLITMIGKFYESLEGRK